jgi:hypothetical protein
MTGRESPQSPQSRFILSARVRSRCSRFQKLGHLSFRSNAFRLGQLRVGRGRQAPEGGKLSRAAGTTGDKFLVLDRCRLFNRNDRRQTGIAPRNDSLTSGRRLRWPRRLRYPICIRLLRADHGLGGWNDGGRSIFKGRSLAACQHKYCKQANRPTDCCSRFHGFSGLHPRLVMTRTIKRPYQQHNILQGVIKHVKKADLRHKRVWRQPPD